ncbi:hypothetical protein [Breoghania sp.]|uniref:hypothetical protein n=1 Tax=Breoghania sp. TaxID=2065378 RepID=UPI0026134B76|nr:hypothetical protein [Breoghania sp.]MDJ0933374.1 hypothetical protein [Breoghania sp.]
MNAEDGISALLHAANVPARCNEATNLWYALSDVAGRETGHLYVLVDDIAPWLMSNNDWDSLVKGVRAEWAGLDARLHLVTTTAFTGTIGGGMPNDFLEMTASGLPFPGEDYVYEELGRLAARLDPIKFEDHLETVLRETDGHPGLVIDLLDAIAAGE